MPKFIVTTHETIIRRYIVEADSEDDAREEIEFCDGETERSQYADPNAQPDANWSVEDVRPA